MAYIAYAVAWLATSAGAIAGIYFTHSAWCLLVFYFPTHITIKRSVDMNSGTEENKK